MKTYGGDDVCTHVFLTSTLVGDEWSASRPGRFTQVKELQVPVGQEAELEPEPIWTKKRTFFIVSGLELQPFRCPACSQQLNRLR
jgi:hypothetical protein